MVVGVTFLDSPKTQQAEELVSHICHLQKSEVRVGGGLTGRGGEEEGEAVMVARRKRGSVMVVGITFLDGSSSSQQAEELVSHICHLQKSEVRVGGGVGEGVMVVEVTFLDGSSSSQQAEELVSHICHLEKSEVRV